jgi:hypothetical protein
VKFDDWVDVEGLEPAERARLERVHALLLEAGPPASLPSGLERPPAQVIAFPVWRRRAMMIAAAAAAAFAAACFGVGYVLGENGGTSMKQVVVLQGAQNSFASLRVGGTDKVGNTPMELTVTGLPEREHGYYELFVWRRGKPGFPCTGFRMLGDKTTVRFTVPYELKAGTKLVVTEIVRGKHDWPGRVVMRSVGKSV